VAAVSRDVAEEANLEFGIPWERLTVIPNGRDEVEYRPLDRDRGGLPRIVFVGHMTAVKRPSLFVEVIESLRGRGRPFEAVMVGDGPLEESLRPRAEAAGIEMLGGRDDVPSILGLSDLLVFTSVPQNEGMPGVLIEAGMCGLAIVTTAVPGARDVIEDGRTGIIVGVDDRDGLIEAVDRLVTDRSLREEMGKGARDRCATHFTLRASARLWDELLAGLPAESAEGDEPLG
jgi:glycosyltransferase involved in cell wall biosynthesis